MGHWRAVISAKTVWHGPIWGAHSSPPYAESFFQNRSRRTVPGALSAPFLEQIYMMIPACKILPYLDFLAKALGPLPSSGHQGSTKDLVAAGYRIQHPKAENGKPGELWKLGTAEEVQVLAEAEEIFGTGSESRLKYLTLDVSPEKAQATLDGAIQSGRVKKLVRDSVPRAEANFTTRHINEPTGQYFEHNDETCIEFGTADRMLRDANYAADFKAQLARLGLKASAA